MDLWPTFWNTFSKMLVCGNIFSCAAVKAEIEQGKDELSLWMRRNATKDFYIPLDQDILLKYQAAQDWAKDNPIFTPNARKTFAENADAYLVATAAAKNLTLVTYEVSDPQCRRQVKIPDVCKALKVEYCDLNTVLRETGTTI